MRDFVAQLYCTTKPPYATVSVATATTRITNMASTDSDDDILASGLVLVISIANKKRKLNSLAQKRRKSMATISQLAHLVCEQGLWKRQKAGLSSQYVADATCAVACGNCAMQ